MHFKRIYYCTETDTYCHLTLDIATLSRKVVVCLAISKMSTQSIEAVFCPIWNVIYCYFSTTIYLPLTCSGSSAGNSTADKT